MKRPRSSWCGLGSITCAPTMLVCANRILSPYRGQLWLFSLDVLAAISFHSLEPKFPPVRIHAFWAQHAAGTISRLTYDCIQDDARVLHLDHLAGLLIDEPAHTFQDSVSSAAVGHQFCVPIHPAISIATVHGLENLSMGLYANQFTRLQIECSRRRWLPLGDHSRLAGKERAAPKPMEAVVEPTHRRPDANPCLTEVVVTRINQAAHEAPESYISGPVILEVLAKVPPGERLRCITHVRGLAQVGRRTSVWVGQLSIGKDI